MERVKEYRRIKIFRAAWHDFVGHPVYAIEQIEDLRLRGVGNVWGRCSSCGMSIKLPPKFAEAKP